MGFNQVVETWIFLYRIFSDSLKKTCHVKPKRDEMVAYNYSHSRWSVPTKKKVDFPTKIVVSFSPDFPGCQLELISKLT
jgi:hypothetical protein